MCGECGTPYKRCTWARNGKKRIVWRCISRLEFGTKYCHNSPTMDEDKLHKAIMEVINEFAETKSTIVQNLLDITETVWMGRDDDGKSLADLRQQQAEITAQQTELLDRVLENMDDLELNAQLKALMEEKQEVQRQIQEIEQNAIRATNQASRMTDLKEWLAQLEVNAKYDDTQVRMAVEKITVVDAETIRIQFKYPGVEVEKKMMRGEK